MIGTLNLVGLDDFIKSLEDDKCLVKSTMTLKLNTCPASFGQVFSYSVYIIQTKYGLGTCYVPYQSRNLSGKYINKDLRCSTLPVPVKTAYFDSLAAQKKDSTTELIKLSGYPHEKMKARAELIIDSVNKIGYKREIKNIALIGAVESIAEALIDSNYRVSLTDMNPQLIGHKIASTIVKGGNQTKYEVANSDCAIVTGMTIGNNTFSEILETAKSNNTSLIMYCETGANLSHFLIDSGVDCVLSEYYPYYIFCGDSYCRLLYKD
jgi:hypothetical protein